MSVKCLDWAFDLLITPTEKFVLVALSDSANNHDGKTWTAWPSINFLVARTSFHETTVKLAIKQLVEWGLISKERRKTQYTTARGNHYTLHIDRQAPQDIVATGSAGQPIQDVDIENEDKSIAYDDLENDRSSTTTFDTDSSATDAKAPQDSTTTLIGTRGQPAYKNRNLEPKNINPPSSLTEGDTAPSLWRTVITTYQQRGYIKFFGEEDPGWRVFKKLPLEIQKKIVTVLPNYLSGKRAQYAKWNAAGRPAQQKPSAPVTIEDFIKTKLFEDIGLPEQPNPEPRSSAKALCEKILQRNAPDTSGFYGWPFWLSVESPQYQQWELFFRAQGFSGAPQQKAGQVMFEYTPKHLAALGIKSIDPKSSIELGFRFPQEWPPEFDQHAAEEAECAA